MTKKKDGAQSGQKKTKRTRNSSDDRIDYSELYLRWEEEITYYAADNNAKIHKEKLPSGFFEYRVQNQYGEVYLTIESARNVVFGPRRKRRRNKRRR